MYYNNDNIEYARMRLANTYVEYHNKLVHIDDIVVGEGGNLYASTSKGETLIKLKELDISSPTLGYVNDNNYSYYITRKPIRRDWRQGIRPQNLVLFFGGQEHQPTHELIKKLVQPINDKYKTFKESLSKVKRGGGSCAFSREFCVKDDGSMWYKERYSVGYVDKDGKPKLHDKYLWLEEALKDATK